jgi:hypothetical protein
MTSTVRTDLQTRHAQAMHGDRRMTGCRGARQAPHPKRACAGPAAATRTLDGAAPDTRPVAITLDGPGLPSMVGWPQQKQTQTLARHPGRRASPHVFVVNRDLALGVDRRIAVCGSGSRGLAQAQAAQGACRCGWCGRAWASVQVDARCAHRCLRRADGGHTQLATGVAAPGPHVPVVSACHAMPGRAGHLGAAGQCGNL